MMSCAATRSADSGRRSLLTRLDGYRRQMCNDELFDEPEHRMRRTLASHIGPHAPLPRVPGAVERVVGVTMGVMKLCASHGVCSLSRAGICVLHRSHTCACVQVVSSIFFIFEPSTVHCSFTHSIACIGFAAPRGVRSGLRSRMHPSSASIRPFVCAGAHTSNLPRASPVVVSQIISHRGCYTRHAAVSDSPKLARGTTQSGVLTAELLAATRSAAEWSRRRGLHRWHVVSRNTGR